LSKWLYLTLAILSEVTATSFLKSSDGFTKFWPSVIVVVGYCLAFYFLSLTLDTIPIGVAYAIWSGVGIASLAVISVLFFDQKIDTAAVFGMGLIIAGVVVLRVFSETGVD
jgi:small multidrug resistance pump